MFSLRHTKALPFYISTLTLSLFSASALADATLFTALDDPSSAKKALMVPLTQVIPLSPAIRQTHH